jgi:hypothetical protein
MEEKEVIGTIFHDDVKKFFKKINLLNEFKQGKLICAVCGERITNENFRIAKYSRRKWIFCCDKDLCLERLSTPINESE